MPSWERFKELYHLRFGPAVRNNRLAELAGLPFLSTVKASRPQELVLAIDDNASLP
jgi:hypothetical protein